MVDTVNDEIMIQKTSSGWQVVLSKKKSDLILTNQRLIFGNLDTIIELYKIKNVEFVPLRSIKLTLIEDTIQFGFSKSSGSHTIDQAVSAFLGSPFEAGSWQEEVSSYTAYWASMLTMTLIQFGNPMKYEEWKEEYGRAYCHRCFEYVDIPVSKKNVWEIDCPKCGRKGMTTLSPEDREVQEKRRVR